MGRVWVKPRTRDETGASTALALGVIIFAGIVMAALATYLSAHHRTAVVYDNIRADRYDGDGAIKAAINWVKDRNDLAVDPAYYGVDSNGQDPNDRCVLPVSLGDETVTVSCQTDAESGSGIPNDVGLVPPDALLLTGARHNEPGPYSTNGCYTNSWNDFTDWVTKVVGGQTAYYGDPETAFDVRIVRRATTIGALNVGCADRTRTMNPVKVVGDVVSAGKINLTAGNLTVHGRSGQAPTIAARYGCGPANKVQRMLPDGSTESGCTDFSSLDPRDDGSAPDSDPGLINPGATSPIGNIKDAFLPVGFQADGAPSSGSPVNHERTTAYQYDPTYNQTNPNVPLRLKPLATCVGLPASQPIIFIPGWYRDVDVLNRYTAQPSCTDRTIWFAPDAGPDRELLTSDDETGPYYFDFSASAYTGPASYSASVSPATNRRGCGGFTNLITNRWCVGGSDTSEPRLVAGTPDGWNPLGVVSEPEAGDDNPYGGGRVAVEMKRAENVDDVDESNWLQFLEFRPWQNLANARVFGDGAYATYSPCDIQFLGYTIFRCPSLGSRTVRSSTFGPLATSPPIEEDDTPTGRIAVSVEYGFNASAVSRLGRAQVEIETTDDRGRTKTCGTYMLGHSSTHQWSTGPMPVYTFDADQQKALAEVCGSKADINSYRMYFKVPGDRANAWFSGDPVPRVYLGGIKISFVTFTGASFPYAPDPTVDPAAHSDCDPDSVGAQFIFGGDSHVYVADGSVEICGGKYPGGNAAAATHQIIGLYGVPEVKPLKVRTFRSPAYSHRAVWDCSGLAICATHSADAKGTWGVGQLRIGEPEGNSLRSQDSREWDSSQFNNAGLRAKVVALDHGQGGSALGSGSHHQAEFNLTMEGFTPPAGYKVSKVSARISWRDGDRYCADAGLFSMSCSGYNSVLIAPNGDQLAAPLTSRRWYQNTNRPELILYDEATGVNRIATTGWEASLSSGLNLSWRGRIPCQNTVIAGYVCIGTSIDMLDGIELDVALAPASTTSPVLIPQSGCITAHPNYSAGEGVPDCALVRADSWTQDGSAPVTPLCWGDNCNDGLRGEWNGRLSVKGTVYAPSSAVELDDVDVAYPLATRGAVLRHLRISGWGLRPGYAESAISNELDNSVSARSTVFTACLQSPSRQSQRLACDENAGDRLLTRAGVSFSAADGGTWANIPFVDWWSDQRMTA